MPETIQIHTFTFNMYQENTFLIADEEGTCAIIDPGCYSQQEQSILTQTIKQKGWEPVALLNTHGHIDHMLGNAFVKRTYDVPFITHEKVVGELESVIGYASMMGLSPEPSPAPDQYIVEGDVVEIGKLKLKVFFTPGHSPGHVSFYHADSKNLFSGDVLFMGSIGRVDLPGGDYDTLMRSIFDKLLPLGDDVQVHCGHGPGTSIGRERIANPFVLQYAG